MKRRLLSGVLAVMLLLLLAGCGCEHVWLAATCTAPRTCELCGETQDEPLGHTWQDATCTEAKTCSVCKATEGEPLGHTWQDATCTEVKTCTVCKTTEGEPLGHTWQEATTEAPQTCEVCALTEGEKLVTDPRFTTASTRPLHGQWITTYKATPDDMGLVEDFTEEFVFVVRIDFGKTGEMVMTMEMEDEEAFMEAYREYNLLLIYEEMRLMGYNKEQTDQQMQEAYGMATEEYVDYVLKSFDMTVLLQAFNMQGIYYVEGDQMYTGLTWGDKNIESNKFSVRDGALIIEGVTFDGQEDAVWHRG